jgi:hypothetical protein
MVKSGFKINDSTISDNKKNKRGEKKMKTFRLILSVLMALAMVSLAYAGTVTVDNNPMGMLSSMTVSDTGDVNITTVPQGSGLYLSVSGVFPGGTVDQAYSHGLTMTASGGTLPYNFNCTPDVGGFSGAISNVTSTSATCTVTGTSAVPVTVNVQFSVDDSAAVPDQYDVTRNISITATPPPPVGGYPKQLLIYPEVLGETIPPLASQNYYADIIQDTSLVDFQITTRDWSTNQDMIVSDVDYPTCNQVVGGSCLSNRGCGPPWYSIKGGNDEIITVNKFFSAGQRLYVTICNKDNISGEFAIFWAAGQ